MRWRLRTNQSAFCDDAEQFLCEKRMAKRGGSALHLRSVSREEDFRVENTEAKRSRIDICVLLLDSDATRLANLSEMIRNCGYRVVATTRAVDLPLIINNKDKKIDLVLAEFPFIEMNNYELLEKIRVICDTPIVVVGAYVEDAIVECLCREATFYLEKDNLKYLWQIVFRSQRDTNPPEKKYSITHTQSLGVELKHNNKKIEVKTEGPDEYEGGKFESGDQKNPELRCPDMQNKIRETDDELSQGKKRKERAGADTGEHTEKNVGSDFGEQKKPKLISADDLQKETQEAIPNIEDANNERKESTEIKKNGECSETKNPEPVCMEEEVEKWSTEPVTDFAACVEYEYQDRELWPLESVGESVGPHEIPLSPRESSNRNVAAQNRGALDEEVMQDGISLADLEFDLMEGEESTCDLENAATQALFDEIYTDLANELKP